MLAFSHDGSRLASGGASGLVDVWDTRSGLKLGRLRVPATDLVGLAFQPGDTLLAALPQRGPAFLIDARSGSVRRRISLPDSTATVSVRALSPHALRIACAWRGEGDPWMHLRIHGPAEPDTGRTVALPKVRCYGCLPPLRAPDDPGPPPENWDLVPVELESLAFAENDSLFAGFGDGVFAMNVVTGALEFAVPRPDWMMVVEGEALAISARARRLTVNATGGFALLDLRGRVLARPAPRGGAVRQARFLADGGVLGLHEPDADGPAADWHPSTPCRWSAGTAKAGTLLHLLEDRDFATALTSTDAGDRIAVSNGFDIRIAGIADQRDPLALGIRAEAARRVAFDAAGRLAVGFGGGSRAGLALLDLGDLQSFRWIPGLRVTSLSTDLTEWSGSVAGARVPKDRRIRAHCIACPDWFTFAPDRDSTPLARPAQLLGDEEPGVVRCPRTGAWAEYGSQHSLFAVGYGPLSYFRDSTNHDPLLVDEACIAAAFSADGTLLAGCVQVARDSFVARVWNEGGSLLAGRIQVARDSFALKVWDTATLRSVAEWGSRRPWEGVRFDVAGRSLLAMHREDSDRWHIRHSLEVRPWPPDGSVAITPDVLWQGVWRSPDGRVQVTAELDSLRVTSGGERAATAITSTPAGTGLVHPTFALSPDARRLVTIGTDGDVQIWDVAGDSLLVRIAFLSQSDQSPSRLDDPRPEFVALTPRGEYLLSSAGARRAVRFEIDGSWVPGEQFDLLFNRPDRVYERLHSLPAPAVAALRETWTRRLRSRGVDEHRLAAIAAPPAIRLVSPEPPLSTTADHLEVVLEAEAARASSVGWSVRVNGSPVTTQVEPSHGAAPRARASVPLLPGRNRIEARFTAGNGVASSLLRWNLERTSKTPPARILYVGIGVSNCGRPECRLEFARKDVEDLARALADPDRPRPFSPDPAPPVDTLLLVDSLATRENFARAARFLRQARPQDLVVVSLAGHGVLDADGTYYFGSYGFEFDRPSRKGTPYAEIEAVFDSVQAIRKLLLLDTCQAGDADPGAPTVGGTAPTGAIAARGTRPVAPASNGALRPTETPLPEYFAGLTSRTGAAVIAASGPRGASYEDPAFGNGAFTRAVLETVWRVEHSDPNFDGVHSVSELRDYVFARVARLTRGVQAPTVRRENPDWDFPLW